MAARQSAPYGSWKSPITADLITAGTVGFNSPRFDGQDTYWIETRPTEGGRGVIMRRSGSGHVTDCTPAGFNVRTRVHEYGGGAYSVDQGTLLFSNYADQRLYRQDLDAEPQPLTTTSGFRFADAVIDRARGRLICVREEHSDPQREPINILATVDLEGDAQGQTLQSGYDFYASPALSPDGTRLAWLCWNHPNMPWDGTELWVADIDADGALQQVEQVAGGPNESIFQPCWSPDGVLHFVSDRSGWWNLYHWRDRTIENLCPMEAEFGTPQWVFGMSRYAFVDPERILCVYTEQGHQRLAILHRAERRLEPIQTPWTVMADVQAGAGRAIMLAASPTEPTSLVELDLTTLTTTVLRRSSNLEIDPEYLSIPEAIEFPTEQGLTAHGFFYPPRNKDWSAPVEQRPPLLVMSHGGPTSATTSALSLKIQFWTSRGIAVLDVNYGGSTGYGRAYRERLNGQWGVVDVDDCVNGANYLVEQGRVDGARLAITGGSAGGYTTLCALTFRDTFTAGASHYGVSDMEALARDTHKFEARYLDRLIGPYPARADLYRERSPIHFTDRLKRPVIFFQGLEDPIVPPNQAEVMVEALRTKGVPVAYVAFEGEQHGFRRAEHIKRALEGELFFYSRVFGFGLAEPVEPVPIENLT